MPDPEIDPERFAVHRFDGRGFGQAYVRENPRFWAHPGAFTEGRMPAARPSTSTPMGGTHQLVSATRAFCRDLLA
jgi:hypothetical protein